MRRKPGRPPVLIDRIVAVALEIVKAEGAEALSMRTLAQRLGSGTATLYRHFANRAALVSRVVDYVFGEAIRHAGELTGMPWSDACRTMARAMFETVRRHENVAPLLGEQIPVGPNAMVLRESCIAVLRDNGFSVHLATRSYATLARYVLGFAIQASGRAGEGALDRAQLSTALQASDPSRFPAITAVADSLPVPLEEEFQFGLDLLLRGLAQVHREDRRAGSRRAR